MAQPMYDINLRRVAGVYYGESSYMEMIRQYTPGELRVQCPECGKFYDYEKDWHDCLINTNDNEPPVNYDPVRYDFECEF